MASAKPPDDETDRTRTDHLAGTPRPAAASRPQQADQPPRSAEVRRAMEALARRSAAELVDTGDVLGEGGMGVVRDAVQRSIGRGVVVKTLRRPGRGPEDELRLLREAWLTASLEHPSVVPVHDVVLDPERGPLIVSRKVQGIVWEEVLDDAEEVRRRFHADDLFVFNVEVIMQLCRVIHFAHSHGVVHRDLKPANVMIGDYGEVYLLDWGIAVSLREDPTGRLPLSRESPGGVGTPAYMAPEMLDPTPGRCDARTDIYLLGAVLYRIATGRPPHVDEDSAKVVASITRSRPAFTPDVSEQLQEIIARAMAPSPADRYATAEDLRLALKSFLRTRDSMAMLAVALARLADVKAVLAGSGSAQPEEAYALFGACRFALQEALRVWPDNRRAREALGDLLSQMALHLLSRDEVGAARALLAEHPEPDPALVSLIERAQAEEHRRRAELERLRRDRDPAIGRDARRAALGVMGALWTVAPLLADVVDPTTAPALLNYLGPSLLLVLAIGIWYAARASLAKTAINRRFLIALLVGFCAHMVHLLLVQIGTLPPKSEIAMGMVSFGAITAVLAYTAERRLLPLAPLYWGGALVAAGFREISPWVLAATNLILTVYMFAIWAPMKSFVSRSAAGPLASRAQLADGAVDVGLGGTQRHPERVRDLDV